MHIWTVSPFFAIISKDVMNIHIHGGWQWVGGGWL